MQTKHCLWLLLLCCSLQAFSQTNQQNVVTKINQVTIFTNGAQVNRTAKLNLAAGKTTLVFAGISPDIDKQSIQVKGMGKFTILSVVHQMNYLNEQGRREEISKITQQQDMLNARKVQEQNMLKVYQQEEAMLLKNQSIGGSNTGLKTIDLKEAADFQRNRLTEVFQKQTELNSRIAGIDTALRKNAQQLRALNQPKEYATSEVLVTVEAKAASSAGFDLGYYVQNAGWFATYDLKVQDISHPIELNLKANVFQNSGEDWKDVKLMISNGNPSENSVAPALQPWFLRYGYNPPPGRQLQDRNEAKGRIVSQNGEPVSFASVTVKGSNIGTQADGNGFFNIRLPENAGALVVNAVGFNRKEVPVARNEMKIVLEASQALQEVVVTAGFAREERDGFDDSRQSQADKTRFKMARDENTIPLMNKETYQTTTIIYEIELPYTVLNDGKLNTVDVKSMEVPALYEYFAAPKIDPSAYLTARIPDWQELNLMEGEINLFFEGAFLGKSVLDLGHRGDTLNLSLGKDQSIQVMRKKLKEFTSKQFLSSNKTDNRAYEITVRNNKQQPVTIILQDQFPVSTTKEITIDEQESSGAQVDTDTKLLTWKYQLDAKQEKTHLLKYSVKYPRNQVLVLE